MVYINCPKCGATILGEGQFCPHCGASILSARLVPPAVPAVQKTPEMPPKTWLVESILATLFCCLPFGVVGIVFASRVESNWYAGNRELAHSSARNAKAWTLVSFFVGLGGVLIYLLLVIFGAMAGFWSAAGSGFYS